ncbi:PRTRC system protein B [Burkholderia sp. AU32262]|uniref:PRTRC system protein B n=1 Tax=Burkholderia sp. AU32262 TaxID=2879630 RepID=UPI001CF437A6|nr:PRTRC system protein B [Burkholderia sp. AU32262]MCA8240607.1 PRTRC system protein B [Burkholderia sp. AU32262]HDR9034421.1 PRTRC system protein B [Burkholderia vietnamiensis]
MTTVDIYCEGSTHLELDSALLLYRNKSDTHVYVTRHAARVVGGVPTLLAGEPVTERQLAAFAGAAAKHVGQQGFVHERVIFAGPGVVAWWMPAGVRHVWFKTDEPLGMRAGPAHQPTLLFIAQGDCRHVFALAENKRPQRGTDLFQAPYYNVYSSGSVCTGNVEIAKQPNAADVEHYEEEFFRSRFTHPNAAKLIQGGSISALWCQLLDGAEFPTERLVPVDLTVESAIQRLTPRS